MHRLLHHLGGGTSCFRAASLSLAWTLAMLAKATVLAEAPNADLRAAKPAANGVERVELFEAIQARQISVKLIPKDSTQAQLLIANRTRRPLNVRLPRAFGGTPALAQIGGGGGAQAIGGGLGAGAAGAGGGFFNVPAEKTGKLKLACVCLEHGKREPRPAIPYEIRPIEAVSDNPAVAELCVLLGQGRVSQRAAQAAAWHLEDELDWQSLAAKQIEHLDGRCEPYFTASEIYAAVLAVGLAQTSSLQHAEPTQADPSVSDRSPRVDQLTPARPAPALPPRIRK